MTKELCSEQQAFLAAQIHVVIDLLSQYAAGHWIQCKPYLQKLELTLIASFASDLRSLFCMTLSMITICSFVLPMNIHRQTSLQLSTGSG